MKYHKKSLYIALAFAGCVALGGCSDFKKQAPLESASLAQKAEYGRMAASEITACKNFGDLKKHFSAFSAHLEKIADGKDTRALFDLYETLRPVMIGIMDNTRMENRDVPYVDDLVFLSRLFEEEKTRSARMAAVFLSLPRLQARAIILPWDEGSLEPIRRHTEKAFLLMLENNGFGKLADAIRKYWYKEDGMPPSEKDRLEFFRSFAGSY